MQNPIDPARMLGRKSTVHTNDGLIAGTIVTAGPRGLTLAVASTDSHQARQLVSVPASDVVTIRTN